MATRSPKLSFDYASPDLFTIAELRLLDAPAGSIARAGSLGTLWRYVPDCTVLTGDGSAPADDGVNFLDTPTGYNSRWFRIDAKPYVALNKSGSNQTITTGLITWGAKSDQFGIADIVTAESIGPGTAGSNNGLPLGVLVVAGQITITGATDNNLYDVLVKLNGTTVNICGIRSSGTGTHRIPVFALISIISPSDVVTLEASFSTSEVITGTVTATNIRAYYIDVTSWREP